LYLFTDFAGFPYMLSALFAAVLALFMNYFLNNKWSFADRRNHRHFIPILSLLIYESLEHLTYFALLYLLTDVIGLYYLASSVLIIVARTPIKYVFCYFIVWKENSGGYIGSDSHEERRGDNREAALKVR